MDDSWPGPITDTVRTALADHGAEMLPDQVEAWLRWIPDNVCTDPGGPGREDPDEEPFDAFLPSDWCHLILIAHRLVPGGPDSINGDDSDEIKEELEDWYLTAGPCADNGAVFDGEPEMVVLPLAVFTKGLGMLAAATVSTQVLLAAYFEAEGGDPRSHLATATDGGTDPRIDELMAVDAMISQLVLAASAVAGSVRDTAGDIEVIDTLVTKMADALYVFARMELVRDLQDTPRVPEFLGTIGSLASQCVDASVRLSDELERAFVE